MNKHILLIVAVFTFCLTKSNAQDTLGIKVGFFFNPQAVFDLKDLEQGSKLITPLFLVGSFSKGRSVVNLMYNLTYNNIQVVYFRKFSDLTGIYVDINKRVLEPGGYIGTGVTRSLADGRAVGFLEFGSGWDQWTPVIYTGVIMPFTFKVK